ncbi:hypothetical protein JCM5350_001309 [Sporobolomyces pararoseus]
MSIKLSTSDDPPVVIEASRTALIAHSRVFADMLSLDLKFNSNEPIPLDDKARDVNLFVKIIEGSEVDATLEKMGEQAWEAVAKMADKYDSWSVRKIVEAKAW